ncbi:hypothetical protein LX36DRAFT_656617 [Colletotrichum falcatum]|nr:hypothetical protein LX36DRAFT_656617 [Colletotrichum falcatum]
MPGVPIPPSVASSRAAPGIKAERKVNQKRRKNQMARKASPTAKLCTTPPCYRPKVMYDMTGVGRDVLVNLQTHILASERNSPNPLQQWSPIELHLGRKFGLVCCPMRLPGCPQILWRVISRAPGIPVQGITRWCCKISFTSLRGNILQRHIVVAGNKSDKGVAFVGADASRAAYMTILNPREIHN